MKRALVVLIAGIALLAGLPAFAQAQTASAQQPVAQSGQAQEYPKEAYVKNIPIIRILVHPLGYKLFYWKSNMTIGELYVPLAWFTGDISSKAAITYAVAPSRPYLTITWVDGKFERVTINALDDLAGPTWGTLNSNTDLSAQFNIQEPPKDY